MSLSVAVAETKIPTPCGILSSRNDRSQAVQPCKLGGDTRFDWPATVPFGRWWLAPFFLGPFSVLRGIGRNRLRQRSQVLETPRASLAGRLRDFATNRHEECG